MHNLDVLFINPGNSSEIYQDLAKNYATIEPPTWALLLAQSCRSIGHTVAILDVNAEQIKNVEVIERIKAMNPKFICFVVYGQNVNAGTVSMSGAVKLSTAIKEEGINTLIGYIGSYVQALPKKALLDEPSIDIVFMNEGVYSLRNLLSQETIDIFNLENINGIAWKKDGEVIFNKPERIVPNDKMDTDLPGYAWDLLPFNERPLDLYRAPMWHAEYDPNKRTPYAALQTSLGCQFGCSFCMINILNRDDNDEIGVASNYSKMRYWSPEFIIKEFDKLVEMGVETIRIVDEMFLLNKKYYVPLCEMLKERGYGEKLRMWAYSRVDTVTDPDRLKLVREAGIKWLCLGIESADRNVRLEVSKGRFQDVDIARVIEHVHNAGIEIMANYIVGLPGDTQETMQKTLDLSLELNTSGWNTYAAMALPGSQLYKTSLIKGYELPITYTGYSFHAYDTVPMPTETLTPAQILKFRDEAFNIYHNNPKFLSRIERLFDKEAADNIQKMTKVKLKRKILGD
jgi:anaerobic magnesium-protoporphyrin IX monomethyl ester cyclase